jgi:hypothetical protein
MAQMLPTRTFPMSSRLPPWAVWSIVVPLVLLSPVIAFLMAMAVEIGTVAVLDVGGPLLVVLGAGLGTLL